MKEFLHSLTSGSLALMAGAVLTAGLALLLGLMRARAADAPTPGPRDDSEADAPEWAPRPRTLREAMTPVSKYVDAWPAMEQGPACGAHPRWPIQKGAYFYVKHRCRNVPTLCVCRCGGKFDSCVAAIDGWNLTVREWVRLNPPRPAPKSDDNSAVHDQAIGGTI